MSKTVRRDATKRDRDIRRSKEKASLYASMAHLSPKASYGHYRDLEARYAVQAERSLHQPRGRRG